MADRQALGHTGAPFRFDVERGKIREFARATGTSNPAYLDSDEPPCPPTFLTTQFFWQEGESDVWQRVALDQRRGLHAEQEYVFHGPPPTAGSELTARSTVTEMYTKQGRRGGELTFAVMVTEFRDAQGRLVAEARMTGVETGGVPEAS